MQWTNEEFERALDGVGRRSRVDAAFRALALKDASAAILQVSGKPLPEGADFEFLDNSGTSKRYPLPDPLAEITTQEISDEALEHVAGGDTQPQNPTGIVGTIKWSR